jgi:hypothetical protein
MVQAVALSGDQVSSESNIINFIIELPMPAPTVFKPVVNLNTSMSRPFIVGLAKNNSKVKIYIDKNIEQKINEFFEYIKLKNEFDIIIFDDSSIVDYAVLCRKTYIHTLVLITKNNL